MYTTIHKLYILVITNKQWQANFDGAALTFQRGSDSGVKVYIKVQPILIIS